MRFLMGLLSGGIVMSLGMFLAVEAGLQMPSNSLATVATESEVVIEETKDQTNIEIETQPFVETTEEVVEVALPEVEDTIIDNAENLAVVIPENSIVEIPVPVITNNEIVVEDVITEGSVTEIANDNPLEDSAEIVEELVADNVRDNDVELSEAVEGGDIAVEAIEDLTLEQEDVIVRQGAQMAMNETTIEQGHFVSTSTGEIVTDVEASENIVPENINLFIAETSTYRLSDKAIEGLPGSVTLVVWPDSPLANTKRPFYLLTPPLSIMDSYALKDIVNDQSGLYQAAFPPSKGLFVRDLAVLAESSEFTRAVYAQMAESDKSLIMFSGYVDPLMNEIIDETQIDFRRVDFVIEQDHERVSVDEQWQAIVEKARHGEELNILLEADENGLEMLKASIGN